MLPTLCLVEFRFQKPGLDLRINARKESPSFGDLSVALSISRTSKSKHVKNTSYIYISNP